MHLNINLDWLSAKGLPILGLDISTTAVKLVELSDAGKGMLRVERYVIEPLPKDAVTDGNIANLDQVADALRTAWKDLGTRIKNVALALPSSAVITKRSWPRPASRGSTWRTRWRPRPTRSFPSRSMR